MPARSAEFATFRVPPGRKLICHEECVAIENPDPNAALNVTAWVAGEEPPLKESEAEQLVRDGERQSHPVLLENHSGRDLVFRLAWE